MTAVAGQVAGAAYIVAALLFILSLAGLSKHETSRRGVTFGILGMAIALVATVWVTAWRASTARRPETAQAATPGSCCSSSPWSSAARSASGGRGWWR